jgi:hypothetical protein
MIVSAFSECGIWAEEVLDWTARSLAPSPALLPSSTARARDGWLARSPPSLGRITQPRSITAIIHRPHIYLDRDEFLSAKLSQRPQLKHESQLIKICFTLLPLSPRTLPSHQICQIKTNSPTPAFSPALRPPPLSQVQDIGLRCASALCSRTGQVSLQVRKQVIKPASKLLIMGVGR